MPRTFLLSFFLSGCAFHVQSEADVASGAPSASTPSIRPDPAAAPSVAAPSVAAPSIVWSALHDSWHLDRSKSTRALDVYVPTSVDLKVSRFRPRMEFEADGTLRVLAFGHTDRHRMVEGTWTRTGESITLRYDASEHSESVVRTLEVESLKQGELVLKRRAREGQGSAS